MKSISPDEDDGEEHAGKVENFNLKTPCANCPFRHTGAIELNPGRVEGIVENMRESDFVVFPCHKTTYGSAREVSACAGAMAYMMREGRPPVLLRVAVSMGMVSMRGLEAVYPLLIEELPQ